MPPPADPPACKDCQYWAPIPPTPQHPHCGECHRHAPMPVVGEASRDAEVVINHPITHFDHWCGEFKKK